MARGDALRVDRARVADAVARAERTTGLEICVAVCPPAGTAPREQAEQAFARLGLDTGPGVLVLVVPESRSLEIVTSAAAQGRVSDIECERAASAMSTQFASGDLAAGIELGLDVIVSAAGPGTGANPGDEGELPDLIDP